MPELAKYNYIHQKQWQQRRLESGYCKTCGKEPPQEGKIVCLSCKKRKQLGKIRPTHEQLIALGFDYDSYHDGDGVVTSYNKEIKIKINDQTIEAIARLIVFGDLKKNTWSCFAIHYNDYNTEIELKVRSAAEIEMAIRLFGN